MSATLSETNVSAPAAGSRLRPRRTLNRLALALLGLVLGLAGQYLFEQGSVRDGLLFYLAAILIFVRTLGPRLFAGYRFSPLTPAQMDAPAIRSGWLRNVGLWLILVGVGLSVLSYNFFGRPDDTQLQAWWLYAISLGLLVAGSLILTPNDSPLANLRRMIPNRAIALGLALVVGLALFMRLYNFTEQPFGIWFDEAEAGLQARQLLQNPDYRPLFYPPINVTGHFLGLYAAALAWLGDSIYALRLVSVLFGIGGVMAAFLFGQELRGPRFGLALAFFMAVARWPVNFSRVAMTGIDTPFFEFLSLYFLVRLAKRGRLRDALWAGLTIGFGLAFYTAFRLYLLALALFVMLAALYWWRPLLATLRHGLWRRAAGAGALLLLAIWLTAMPLVKFALDNPEAFWYRTNQISILTKRDQSDLRLALWESGKKHLQMFNIAGDKNGRHNLPGEPMLDFVMGVLFILGVGLTLTRPGYPANSFFLILLPVGLLGGILSVDFEAPQSLRSIAVIPAVIYFCGLAVAALGKEADRVLSPLPAAWVVGPAVVAAGYIFVSNAVTYFDRQANDFASWNAFSAPETITARKMAELGRDYVYILSPFLTNHPTTRFLAPDVTNQQYLSLPDALPIRDPSGRPVAMFIHPDDQWVFDDAKRLYPNAQYEVLTGPSLTGDDEGPPSVYFAAFQPNDLQTVRGLELRYLPPADTDPTEQPLLAPLHTSRAFAIDVTWPDDSPTDNDFVATWTGVLYAPRYGPYSFRLAAPGSALLEIDGNAVIETTGSQQGLQMETIQLAEGNHAIRVQAKRAAGQLALYWQRPGFSEELVPTWALYSRPISNHGLLGTFYPNNNWEGQPAFQRIDPFLDTYFHLVPMQRPYTVEWRGRLIAPQSGVYRLGLRAVQEAQLFINDIPLLNTPAPNEYTETPISLEAGQHELLIRYRDSVDRSRIHLTWIPPSGNFEAIPKEYLWPPMGYYPTPDAPAAQDAIQIEPLVLEYEATLGMPGQEIGQFLEPRDVAVLSDGSIAVADTGNRRVQLFGPQLNFLTELTGDEFPFEEPLAVDVLQRPNGDEDEIVVLDSTLQWIYRYDAAGNFIDRIGGPGARLFHPRGMNVFEDNTIAVSDTGTARLALFNAQGEQLGSIGGQPGPEPGQLNEPTDVLRDAQGAYFVAEAENNRLQRLDGGGNFLNQWRIPPSYAFNGPHLAFGPDGSILMTEPQGSSLLRYTPTGILIDQWQTIGPVRLVIPVGLTVDEAANRLFITDVATHQVHIFKLASILEEDN